MPQKQPPARTTVVVPAGAPGVSSTTASGSLTPAAPRPQIPSWIVTNPAARRAPKRRVRGISKSPSGLHESHGRRVHAVAQAGRPRTIVEEVAEVGVAAPAGDGSAHHAQARIAMLLDVA